MTADTCPTCPDKDDQIEALVVALEALLEAGPAFGRCVCGRKFLQEHRRGCAWIKALHVHADIPAAARERAEERERLRTVARRLKILDDQGKVGAWDPDEPGAGLSDEFADALHELFAALTGEKAE